MIGFNNGSYEPVATIGVPVTSLSINRGYGAFEFFEITGGRPFYGERHLARFRRSMQILNLKTDFDDQLEAVVAEVIRLSELQHAYLKLYALPHELNCNGRRQAALYVFPTEMPLFDPMLYKEGAKLVTHCHQRFLPEAKSTNYLPGQFWMDQEADPRVADVLYHNGRTVQESSRGNIFAVKDGAVITPAKDVLQGITRGLVLEMLPAMGILHTEAELSLELLYGADELFVSSTTKHILPVTQVDDKHIGSGKPGPVTCQIREQFMRLKYEY
ncbi:D-alanine transaminase/branched-chain amino acid aminotransferase [Mangrovibacterium marinum]|uniref:branched-chain-amino-acid transaminase n=1 Tax=Mangrovibacterium marinum TaxID=1639118 RepID=A0A2T5BXF2_9BACT|nr:aminotransferase class IV [Mangrovibacterium marinum]PTN04786.1 D-alanine transaminase/branched-chain amino acid aminotransferase [Mangrovibacterium marinum]